MNLSFSTRGWSEYSWEELVDLAQEMGFTGIEVYDLHENEELISKDGPFHKFKANATMRDLRAKDIQIPVLDNSVDISVGESSVDAVKALIDVAAQTGIEYVAVRAENDNEDAVRAVLDQLVPYT